MYAGRMGMGWLDGAKRGPGGLGGRAPPHEKKGGHELLVTKNVMYLLPVASWSVSDGRRTDRFPVSIRSTCSAATPSHRRYRILQRLPR